MKLNTNLNHHITERGGKVVLSNESDVLIRSRIKNFEVVRAIVLQRCWTIGVGNASAQLQEASQHSVVHLESTIVPKRSTIGERTAIGTA